MPKTNIHSKKIDCQRLKIDHLGPKIDSQRSKFEISHIFVPSAKIRHLFTKIPPDKKRQFNKLSTHHPSTTHTISASGPYTGEIKKKYIGEQLDS